MRSARIGSLRSGPSSTRSRPTRRRDRHRARARALERHGRAPPRAGRARDRPGRRGRVLVPDVRRDAIAIVYPGATRLRRLRCSTWTINTSLLEDSIAAPACGRRPRARRDRVDLYGQSGDYDALRVVCERHDVQLIQDAAESLGASYSGTPAGGQGVLAVLSFNGNKIITTSGGGMLVTQTPTGRRCRYLATQAREPVRTTSTRNRVQLPAEQPPGGGRSRPARGSPRAGRSTRCGQRPATARCSRTTPGARVHAGRRLG